MKRVIIESPLGRRLDGTRIDPGTPEFEAHQRYVEACMLDSFKRGEAPFASHQSYPAVLNDAAAEEIRLGMEAGFAWGAVADLRAVYTDRGVTEGMKEGIEHSRRHSIPVEYRSIES